MNSRAQLRERIRASSLDEVVLEEMILHGFWGRDQSIPDLPQSFFERRREIQSEISDILARDRYLSDPDKAMREIMKERMRLARQRRIETKRKLIEKRNARGAAYDKKRRENVLSLGDISSAPLQNTKADLKRLMSLDIPALEGAVALSEAMGIGLPELKFLTYDARVARQTHYQTFTIPKKTGDVRRISAPRPRLKRAQYWVLDRILSQISPHDAAHGFRKGRSIVTNAQPHVGKELVINMDLKDFFPTITYPRVKGLFKGFGYAEADAALLALICTEAEREKIEIDSVIWHVAQGPRKTPQGAPTSPAIANLVTRKLDRRLAGLAKRFGFAYSRYADDMTFSGNIPSDHGLKSFHRAVKAIVEEEGFAIHPDKTRFMRKGDRQEVTGLVVNEKISVPREERRKFRAWLHQAKKNGQPMKPFRAGDPVTSAQGYASFLYMVGGTEGMALAEKAWMVLGRQTGVTSEIIQDAADFRLASAKGRLPHPDWWQPADPPPFKPTPLPGETVKIKRSQKRSGTVPQTGERRSSTQQRPLAQEREEAALRRADYLEQKTPSKGRSPFEIIMRLAISIPATAILVVPFIGTLICLTLFYFIWKPKNGYKGFDTFSGKLIVFLMLFLGMHFTAGIGLALIILFGLMP